MDAWKIASLSTTSENLTRAQATTWAEAASVVLNSHGHAAALDLHVGGTPCKTPQRILALPVSEAMLRTHADLQDATEEGAYAISLLAAKRLFGYRFISQVRSKGPGFDFYLSNKPSVFDLGDARLEVSGIHNESVDSTLVKKRVAEKRRQLDRSAVAEPQPTGTVFLIGVVGYLRPVLWLEKYRPTPRARKKRGAATSDNAVN